MTNAYHNTADGKFDHVERNTSSNNRYSATPSECSSCNNVLPWIRTRHIKVDIELPPPKVPVVHFEHDMQRGLLARISRSAIKLSVSSRELNVKGLQSIIALPINLLVSVTRRPFISVESGTSLGVAFSLVFNIPTGVSFGSALIKKTFGSIINGLIHRHTPTHTHGKTRTHLYPCVYTTLDTRWFTCANT
ncbi:hypothetical protein BDR07DRAFT_1484123 [Suillus spraguei]|nr:hypothetical protein BDR07DRAFT_1484123 [Suillus spraguei]